MDLNDIQKRLLQNEENSTPAIISSKWDWDCWFSGFDLILQYDYQLASIQFTQLKKE